MFTSNRLQMGRPAAMMNRQAVRSCGRMSSAKVVRMIPAGSSNNAIRSLVSRAKGREFIEENRSGGGRRAQQVQLAGGVRRAGRTRRLLRPVFEQAATQR